MCASDALSTAAHVPRELCLIFERSGRVVLPDRSAGLRIINEGISDATPPLWRRSPTAVRRSIGWVYHDVIRYRVALDKVFGTRTRHHAVRVAKLVVVHDLSVRPAAVTPIDLPAGRRGSRPPPCRTPRSGPWRIATTPVPSPPLSTPPTCALRNAGISVPARYFAAEGFLRSGGGGGGSCGGGSGGGGVPPASPSAGGTSIRMACPGSTPSSTAMLKVRPCGCGFWWDGCSARSDDHFQAFEGGTWGGTGPTKPHATHSEKRRGMRDAPALLSHLCSPFVNDPTGLTTSFFCVRAMRRGPVPPLWLIHLQHTSLWHGPTVS